jgi:hypothetical protein
MKHFSFNSVQSHINNRPGHRTEVTEAVSIRNGKGKKTIRVRKNNKVTEKAIKLKQGEIKNIMGKKFMPRLFEENHKALRLTRRRKN